MKTEIKWGLVIQGPVIGFGQGPNNSPNGFSAHDVIERNIKAFLPYVSAVVVSTWDGSGLVLGEDPLNRVALLENKLPSQRDHDNRIKQFKSTLAGVEYLAENYSITHVIKIRTDQIVDPEIVNWLNIFFNYSGQRTSSDNSICQEDHLVFSEFRRDTSFYVGDFIIAGTLVDIFKFCSANLSYGGKNLHPSVGVDYVLKYLVKTDQAFKNYFFKGTPLLWQVSNTRNTSAQQYWSRALCTRFSFIPREFFCNINWRGKLMTDILPLTTIQGFSFYEDWLISREVQVHINVVKKYSFLIPTFLVLHTAKYEYVRFLRALVKYYLKKWRFLK